jgi:hypothetical protein
LLQHAALLQSAHRRLRRRAAEVCDGRKLPGEHGLLHTASDLPRPELHRLLSEPMRAGNRTLLSVDAVLHRDVLFGCPRAAGRGVLRQ